VTGRQDKGMHLGLDQLASHRAQPRRGPNPESRLGGGRVPASFFRFPFARLQGSQLRRASSSLAYEDEHVIALMDVPQKVFHVHLPVLSRTAGDGFRIKTVWRRPSRGELDLAAGLVRQGMRASGWGCAYRPGSGPELRRFIRGVTIKIVF
jgi:hypothetical protein